MHIFFFIISWPVHILNHIHVPVYLGNRSREYQSDLPKCWATTRPKVCVLLYVNDFAQLWQYSLKYFSFIYSRDIPLSNFWQGKLKYELKCLCLLLCLKKPHWCVSLLCHIVLFLMSWLCVTFWKMVILWDFVVGDDWFVQLALFESFVRNSGCITWAVLQQLQEKHSLVLLWFLTCIHIYTVLSG